MRIAVMGAGGTGGYFGGLLARAGEEVAFIARGAHLAAIRERGLTVKSRLVGDFTVLARATDTPSEIGPVDLVLFCVKTYDNEAAAELIRPLVGPETVVLSVQNGIDNEERIGRAVGRGAVVGAIAGVSSVVESPGVIRHHTGPDLIRVGELDGGISPRVERIVETLRRAGIKGEAHPNIIVPLWEKLLFICALSGGTALTRLPIGPLVAVPETRALLRGVMAEVEAVGRAVGVALPADCVARTDASLDKLDPAMRGSLYYDLAAGRRLEIDALNGTVVRLGREHGVAAPLNFAIYAALKPYADGAPS